MRATALARSMVDPPPIPTSPDTFPRSARMRSRSESTSPVLGSCVVSTKMTRSRPRTGMRATNSGRDWKTWSTRKTMGAVPCRLSARIASSCASAPRPYITAPTCFRFLCTFRSSVVPPGEQALGALQVLGGVDLDAHVARGHHPHADSVLQEAQALHLLGPLERPGRQAGESEQGVAPEGVDPDVLPEGGLHRGIADVGNGGAGEEERVAGAVDGDLHVVGVAHQDGVVQFLHERKGAKGSRIMIMIQRMSAL